MARRFLIPVLILIPAFAVAAEAAPKDRIRYRNGTIVAVSAPLNLMAVDLAGEVTDFSVDETIDLAALRPGDAVLLGIRQAGGRGRVVLVRPALAAAPPPAPELDAAGLAAGAVRRPMRVVPNPSSAPRETVSVAARVPALTLLPPPDPAVDTPPALAAAIEPEPASTIDTLREGGRRELEKTLESLGGLLREADRAWGQYVQACPTAADPKPRAWLSATPADSPPSGRCAELLTRATGLAQLVRSRLDDAEDRARMTSVLPGTVRDVMERYQLSR